MICWLTRGCCTFLFLTLGGTIGCVTDAGGSSAFSSNPDLAALVQDQGQPCATKPVADARTTQANLQADSEGFAYVYLDATHSTAATEELLYAWKDGDKALAAGDYIWVRLGVGTHNLSLTVTDLCGQSATANTQVVVRPFAE